MTTDSSEAAGRTGEAHLALARTNFEPIERFLHQLKGESVAGQGPPCDLELREPMRAVAANTCDVLYAVRHPADRTMLLRFTMVGDGADRVLFQVQQRSAHGGERATGGVLDQHVYRLGEVEELKNAIRTAVTVFLAR